MPVLADSLAMMLHNIQQRLNQIKRQREDDGRVLFHCDFRQGLQVAQLHGIWLRADDTGSLGQLG